MRKAKSHFTGDVTADELATPYGESRLAVYAVTFQPGARTHWHTHPRGQGLYVTQGEALVQVEGRPPTILTPGESVWIEAERRHWHGATTRAAMVHIAYQEAGPEGSTVNWHGAVSERTYTQATKENH
jgi:quercetin dioxygenase-like cupin family protein